MAEMRLTHTMAARRWEAIPEFEYISDVVDRDGVRLLLNVTGDVIGFAFDDDDGVESRLRVLARYIEVEPIGRIISDGATGEVDVVIDVQAKSRALDTAAISTPSVSRANRFVAVRGEGAGIEVRVRLGWWFAMWGMWFTVARGDGLVLADRPVRPRPDTRSLPNAFPVRPDDLRVALRRGPTTVRRVVVAMIAVVLAAVAFAVTRSNEASVTKTEPIPTPTSVPTSMVEEPIPTVTLPIQRPPGSDYVSTDGVARLDVDISTSTIAVGGTIDVELSFDKSAINPFGVVSPGGDQTEAFRSCGSNLDLYREVPRQAGASEEFRIFLVNSAGMRTLLYDEYVQLTLVGAMVEGCPEPVTSGGGPYQILQRTFYDPMTIPVSVPANTEPGDYSISIEVGANEWSTRGDAEIRVG